jgi:RNA polymerase sigma-70 factor (ECF subfamily)
LRSAPSDGAGTDEKESAVFSDEEAVARVRAGEVELFELLLRRYNQRVYRTARAIVRDDTEAEDVVQEAWLSAYKHLDQWEGRAKFSTWLTRIAVREAWSRSRKGRRAQAEESMIGTGPDEPVAEKQASPEENAAAQEARGYLDSALEALPEDYRVVFVLRAVEELSTAETAESLDLTEENVKVRLHRARAMLRRELLDRAGPGIAAMYPFLGERCDRMVLNVMSRIRFVDAANG